MNDQLLRFGCLHANNFDGFRLLSELTQRSANSGEPITLVVLRGGKERIRLTLKPRKWSGVGLLGCHLSALHELF